MEEKCILVGEAQEKSALRIEQVLLGGFLINPVHLVSRLEELFAYLEGRGPYSNRARFPLPLLLLVSLGLLIPSTGDQLRRIRQCDEGARMPIIVMVEDGQEAELDAAYEAGATSYLRKPFSFAEFLERGRITGLATEIVNQSGA